MPNPISSLNLQRRRSSGETSGFHLGCQCYLLNVYKIPQIFSIYHWDLTFKFSLSFVCAFTLLCESLSLSLILYFFTTLIHQSKYIKLKLSSKSNNGRLGYFRHNSLFITAIKVGQISLKKIILRHWKVTNKKIGWRGTECRRGTIAKEVSLTISTTFTVKEFTNYWRFSEAR